LVNNCAKVSHFKLVMAIHPQGVNLMKPIEEDIGDERKLYEPDFGAFACILWKRRQLIFVFTLCTTLISIVIALIIPKTFKSEGFFQLGNPKIKLADQTDSDFSAFDFSKTKANTPKGNDPYPIGFPMATFKAYSSQFYNPNRLITFANRVKIISEEELEIMKKTLARSEDISKWIKPIYTFSRDDAREFTQLPKDEANAAIGLKITYEHYSSKLSHDFVFLLGNYVRDCMVYVALSNYITDGYTTTIAKLNKIENDMLNTKFELSQCNKKKEDIQRILLDYPDSAKIDSRQLVSLQEGGSRYLAPITQLVGIDSTIADLKRLLSSFEFQSDKLKIRNLFFTMCNAELAGFKDNGEKLFSRIKSIRDEIFREKDVNNIVIREVMNNLNIDIQTFEAIYYLNSRFISDPTIPTEHIWPRKGLIAIATLICSFIAIIVWIILCNWWQNTRQLHRA
jgi:hypothetical protein